MALRPRRRLRCASPSWGMTWMGEGLAGERSLAEVRQAQRSPGWSSTALALLPAVALVLATRVLAPAAAEGAPSDWLLVVRATESAWQLRASADGRVQGVAWVSAGPGIAAGPCLATAARDLLGTRGARLRVEAGADVPSHRLEDGLHALGQARPWRAVQLHGAVHP
jgi:hypothetical protein